MSVARDQLSPIIKRTEYLCEWKWGLVEQDVQRREQPSEMA